MPATRVAVGQQPLAEVRPDEPGRAGDDAIHGTRFPASRVWSVRTANPVSTGQPRSVRPPTAVGYTGYRPIAEVHHDRLASAFSPCRSFVPAVRRRGADAPPSAGTRRSPGRRSSPAFWKPNSVANAWKHGA